MIKFLYFDNFFNKKLIKGYPPCDECDGNDSDCKEPCGCDNGDHDKGCGSGGKGGGGAGRGGGNGRSPRALQGWAAPAPAGRSEILELNDAESLSFIENEVNDFIAVGQAIAPPSVMIPPSEWFGGNKGCNGCGGGCGGGGGLSMDFGGSYLNPGITISNGNDFNFTITPFGGAIDPRNNLFCLKFEF